VHADEQVVAREAAPHLLLIGGDGERIGVLDQHRLDRSAAFQRLRFAGQAAPTRDWSSRRTLGSRASSPSIIVLSSLKTPLLE
jgi:hypothetical protein